MQHAVSTDELDGLRPFATEAETQAIDAITASAGDYRSAAASLGIHYEALRARLRECRRRAASRGWSPEHAWNYPVPEGHRIKGNSTLFDATGNVDQQWVKSERDSDDPPQHQPVPLGHTIKKVSTLLDAQGKVRAQWIQAPRAEEEQWQAFWAACEAASGRYVGLAEPVTAPLMTDAETLTVYPLGDPHVGLLAWRHETGEDFDLKIVERDLLATVDLLVERSPPSEQALLVNVGDLFHADNETQLTPASGHKLDCDSRSAKIAEVGFTLVRRLIERLLQKHARVGCINAKGNHDPQLATMINMWLGAVFEREPRVTIERNTNPFAYVRFGKNLLGVVHGDGPKPADLPGIMAFDRPQDWGATEYRLWLTGHIHHETAKEFPGVTVESFRTLAARDYWHNWKGYRAGRSLSAITFHEEFGEITRSTVDLKLARRALR